MWAAVIWISLHIGPENAQDVDRCTAVDFVHDSIGFYGNLADTCVVTLGPAVRCFAELANGAMQPAKLSFRSMSGPRLFEPLLSMVEIAEGSH